MTEQRIPSELIYDNTSKIYIYIERERERGGIYGDSFAIGRILRGPFIRESRRDHDFEDQSHTSVVFIRLHIDLRRALM